MTREECEIETSKAIMEMRNHVAELEKENAELRKVAEFQQSSNMSRHFENKKLKEGLAVGSTFNKALNSMNKNLEEERDKYRDMVFDLQKENAELKEQCSVLADCNTCVSDCKTENIEIKTQLTKAKELLKQWVELYKPKLEGYPITPIQEQTEQFLSEVEK